MAIKISKGKKEEPKLVVLVGGDGVGKSSLAASAPNSVFIDLEEGSSELDVARIEGVTNFDELMSVIDLINREPQDYQTVVIDSLSKIEPWIWEKFTDPGYGRGAELALTFWRKLTAGLDTLRKNGMNIILIAHAWPAAANDPTAEMPYDKIGLRLEKKAAAYIREYVYGVFYIGREVTVKRDNKGDRKGRAINDNDDTRIVYTVGRPAFDAKSRYDLPSEIKLPKKDGWATIFDSAVDVAAELQKLIPMIKDEGIKDKAQAALAAATINPKSLLKRVQDQIESER